MTDQHLRRALEPIADLASRKVLRWNAEDQQHYEITPADDQMTLIPWGLLRRAASALAETDITPDGASLRAALEPPAGHATQSKAWAEIVERYAPLKRADLAGGDLTDLEAAFHVAMLTRDQLDHEAVLHEARDRIRWLSVQLALSASPPPEGLREAIARVMDPTGWGIWDRAASKPERMAELDAGRSAIDMPLLNEIIEYSLAKADQILALVFPTEEEGK